MVTYFDIFLRLLFVHAVFRLTRMSLKAGWRLSLRRGWVVKVVE